MNACKNATINSSRLMATPMTAGANATLQEWKVKIKLMNAKSTTWPAVMFANNRIARAKGFVNLLINSTGVMMSVIGSFIASGMSCGQ